VALSEKEIYRALCRTEDGLPLFSRDWWLDAACGEDHWDALIIEDRGRIAAAMPRIDDEGEAFASCNHSKRKTKQCYQ